MSLSRLGHTKQFPSRRDLDISFTEAPHDGADAGDQRHADHHDRLATTEKRKSAEESSLGAGDTKPNKETRRDLYLVGRREINLPTFVAQRQLITKVLHQKTVQKSWHTVCFCNCYLL